MFDAHTVVPKQSPDEHDIGMYINVIAARFASEPSMIRLGLSSPTLGFP